MAGVGIVYCKSAFYVVAKGTVVWMLGRLHDP